MTLKLLFLFFLAAASSLASPFFPGCYPNDEFTHVLDVKVVDPRLLDGVRGMALTKFNLVLAESNKTECEVKVASPPGFVVVVLSDGRVVDLADRTAACAALSSSSPCLRRARGGKTTCGNGILEPGEACECIKRGSTSCRSGNSSTCVDCKTWSSCSSRGFLVRTPAHADTFIVKKPNACCTNNGKFAGPKRRCGKGVCGGWYGICTKKNPACDFNETGCHCGNEIMPVGTPCKKGNRKRGRCDVTGFCSSVRL